MLDMDEARRIAASYAPPYSACPKALRKALGVTDAPSQRTGGKRRRRRCRPTRREAEDCMRQRHGARQDV